MFAEPDEFEKETKTKSEKARKKIIMHTLLLTLILIIVPAIVAAETNINQGMGGQATRMMTYPMSENIRNATAVLKFQGQALSWYRLDDGVMGGQSSTHTENLVNEDGNLSFSGIINTNGGGFASLRAALPDNGLPENTDAIKVRYRGDGKTYKVILTEGQRFAGGPFSRSPTWQIDLPTECLDSTQPMQEAILSLKDFVPSFGPRKVSEDDKKSLVLIPSEQRLVGFMLSLKLSNGDPNPPSSFGEGIFDFKLEIESVEPVLFPMKEK